MKNAYKSNGSSESESRISNAMSPPQIDKETSTHPQISSNLEQNESPRFNKLDQESASPPRCDVQELKTTLPPQLDKPDSTSLVCFEDKLPESKLQAAKRNSSRKYSPIHYRDASVEDVESLWDSDAEDTASVLNFVGRMNKRAKQKAFNKDMDDIMVCTNAHIELLKEFSFQKIIIIISITS